MRQKRHSRKQSKTTTIEVRDNMSIPSYTGINTNAALSPGVSAVFYPNTFQETGTAGETIPFGYAIYEDTDLAVKIITEAELAQISARNSFGVALFSSEVQDVSSNGYVQKDTVAVGKTGYYTVVAYEQVARGDVVRVQIEAESGRPVGTFGKTATVGKTAVVNGARFFAADSATVATVFLPDVITLTAD